MLLKQLKCFTKISGSSAAYTFRVTGIMLGCAHFVKTINVKPKWDLLLAGPHIDV